MLNKLEAVIFDFDGTILDTEKLYFDITNEVIYDYTGKYLDKVDYAKKIAGTNMQTYRNYFKNNFKELDFEKLEKEINLKLVENFYKVEILPYISDVLKLLKSNNIKIAVASNGDREHIYKGLKLKNIENYIDVIVSKEDIKNPKPAPDVYLYTAKLLDINIKNSIIIEDSKPGIISAVSSGAYTILQTNSMTKYTDFSNINYNLRDCNLLQEIKNILKNFGYNVF